MKRTKDPMLAVFQKRNDVAYREAYVRKEEEEALERRKQRRGKQRSKRAPSKQSARL